MNGKIGNIKDKALQNIYFREVLETGKHTQVVLMSIPGGSEIGEETHTDSDQILYCVEGNGKVILNHQESPFEEGDLVLVNADTVHNFINTGVTDMKIITTYSPPHHPVGTIHKTKEEAQKANY